MGDMKWSFPIARVFGIDIKVHISFFIILVLGALQWRHFGMEGMAFGVMLMVLLFVCVTLHELGHSVVAQRLGIPVRQIVLLPIGGVAVMGRGAMRPKHELWVALAGPAVTLAIVILLGIFVKAWTTLHPEYLLLARNEPPSFWLAVRYLLAANIVLLVFNMIPAFPLDGGRVLRAVLAMNMGQERGTRIAAAIGQVLAVGLGLWGLMSGQLMLTIIAFLIFLAAGAEVSEGQATRVLETQRVGDAYNKYALTLTLNDRLSRVVDYLLTSYQPDFAVLERGRLVGLVTREDVLKRLSTDAYDCYVTEIMRERVMRVEPEMTLEQVRQKMSDSEERVVAVYDGEMYLGLVSAEDITEAMVVLSFINRSREGGAAMPRGVPVTR
jgi:Zn-dependent protease